MSTGKHKPQNKRASAKQQNRVNTQQTQATRPRRSRRSAPEVPDLGEGLFDDTFNKGLDHLFGPSDESKARVAEIRERWEKLQAWGAAEKLPNTRLQQRAVKDFLSAWERSPDVTAISAASADLTAIELYAEDYDRARGGSFRAAPMQSPFDVEGSSRFMRGAVATDKAAREVSAVAKDAARDVSAVAKDAARDLHEAAQPLIAEVGGQLPTIMGLGIAIALFGVVIAVRSMPRVPYA